MGAVLDGFGLYDNLIKLAGVNFAKSNNTCPTTQIAPPTRNAYIKSTIH
ncbi:hypothetical protein ACT453_38650, partial [Bacillus sp. D-CC]